MNYSEEQLKEIIRCRDNIEYFADTYIKYSSYSGIVQVKLNDFQRKVIANFNEKKIFFEPGERMSGKTTVAAIILLHQALFHEYRVSMIFARTKSNSSLIVDLIYEMYERLPDFLCISKISTRNRSKLDFDNMCSIISAGSDPNCARGRAISTIYIDESEWIDSLDEILTMIYPAMASTPYAKIFSLSSTNTADILRKVKLEATI